MPAGPRRSLLDRLFQRGRPRPIAGFAPPPREIAPGVWGLDRLLRLPGGLRLPVRSTILRLGDGSVVVVSAPAPVPGSDACGIDALGEVRQVVAPNAFHYVYAGDFLRRHPRARLLAAPGLVERVPDLPPAQPLGDEPPPGWAGEIDHALFGPVRGVSEVLLFHRATGTLVVTDLAFNMTRFDRLRDRVGWRLAGVPARLGPSRTARLLLLRDRSAAERCLARVAEWPLRGIVVAHGEVVEHDASREFRRAFGRTRPDASRSG